MSKIVRYFRKDKETKNTVRFQEDTDNVEMMECNDENITIGPLYIQKSALDYLKFADQDLIKITIENLD